MNDSNNSLILYHTEDGKTRLECRFQEESLWLSLNQIAELFQRDKSVISKHLKNIFEDQELEPEATVANYATVQKEGAREVKRNIEYYNLEAIFAVGYRVRSPRGAQFRRWATDILKQYVIEGAALDDERLKNPDSSPLFEKVLARIRNIRTSEKVFWRKVCDIFATSVDYDGQGETARAFFKQVQNKMHWAAHGYAIGLIRCEVETPCISLSYAFWQDYVSVRDFRKKHSVKPKQNNVEAMTLNTINAYLREKQAAPLHNFLKTLREDMTDYKTLRRIAEIGGKTDLTLKEIAERKNELDPNYLEQLKKRIGALNEEVIIAIENQKGDIDG